LLQGVIVGCGRYKGQPFKLDWARKVVGDCQQAGVNVYVKQLRIDGKLVTDPKDFPPDLRVRQLPWSMPEGGIEQCS